MPRGRVSTIVLPKGRRALRAEARGKGWDLRHKVLPGPPSSRTHDRAGRAGSLALGVERVFIFAVHSFCFFRASSQKKWRAEKLVPTPPPHHPPVHHGTLCFHPARLFPCMHGCLTLTCANSRLGLWPPWWGGSKKSNGKVGIFRKCCLEDRGL